MSIIYQQRNVVEKQWKKVSTKDTDYDNKFNQYIANKQEIEKLCDTAKDLFDYVSKIDDTTLGKVKKLRDELGLMRFRPMLAQKNNNQNQKWIWPVRSKIITSSYGYRIHPIFKKRIFHYGIDISESNNKPVWAVSDGKVIKAQWNGGYGNYIEKSMSTVNKIEKIQQKKWDSVNTTDVGYYGKLQDYAKTKKQ